MYSDHVRDSFNIPEDKLIVYAVTFACPDAAHPVISFRAMRADISETVVDLRMSFGLSNL